MMRRISRNSIVHDIKGNLTSNKYSLKGAAKNVTHSYDTKVSEWAQNVKNPRTKKNKILDTGFKSPRSIW
jgi:hypothetical protein